MVTTASPPAPRRSVRPARLAPLAVVTALLGALLGPAPAPAAQIGDPVGLVSVNAAGDDSGNSGSVTDSETALWSADGTRMVFESDADDLTADPDTNGSSDVFVRDLTAGTTTLVSVNSSGTAAGNGQSVLPAISGDGTKVAFESAADDLADDDTNNTIDVFVRDLGTGTTTLVSVNSSGTASGAGISDNAALSADGARVAFRSFAPDLAALDADADSDIFVRDLGTGITQLVSINSGGTNSGLGGSSVPVISADGSKVAFQSDAVDLAAPDTDAAPDVFVRDLTAGMTTLVSINAAGTDSGNGTSSSPVMNPDGTRIAFFSVSSDLAGTDTNLSGDVFVRDLVLGTTTMVSVNSAGSDSGNGTSGGAVMSADGTRIAFTSSASDLAAPDSDTAADVFVRDLVAGTTTLVSVNADEDDSGNGPSGIGGNFTMSADGTRIAFPSEASDLAAPDSDTVEDVFVRDVIDGATTLVSVNATGTASGDGASTRPWISPDGTRVAFDSDSSDLAAPDTDSDFDVFVSPAQLPGTVQFSAVAYGVDEDAGSASVTLTRTGGADGTVTVDLTTADGTATAGADYSDADTTVTFLPGQTTAGVTVPILNDPTVEDDETVTLALVNPGGGAQLGTPTAATLTIIDNDVPSAGADLTIAVQGGDPTFTIDGPVDDTVVVEPGEAVTLTDLPAGAYTITLVDPDDVVVDTIECGLATVVDMDLPGRSITIQLGDAAVTCLFTISPADDDDPYDTYDDDPGDPAFDFDTPFDNDAPADVAGTNPPSAGNQSAVAGDQLATAGDPGSDLGAAGGILPAVLDMLPRTGLGAGLTLAGGLLLAAGGLATVLGRRRRTGES